MTAQNPTLDAFLSRFPKFKALPPPDRNLCARGKKERDRIYCYWYGGTCGCNPQKDKCHAFMDRRGE